MAKQMRRASQEAAASASAATDSMLSAIADDTGTMLLQEAADRAVCTAWHSLVLKGVDPVAAVAAVIGRTSAALITANMALALQEIQAEMAEAAANVEQ